MQPAEIVRHGEHVLTICNACRYCEQYCPVFPAVEQRLTFTSRDLAYLANLCHNCGDCLYACQYAPPHEFGVDVPATLAKIRLLTYEEYCWPRGFGGAFRRQGLLASVLLVAGLILVMLVSRAWGDVEALWTPNLSGNFYAVIPHRVMVSLFGGVSAFILVALTAGVIRFWRDIEPRAVGVPQRVALMNAFRDALTLRHLQGSGEDCATSEESRSPWRRWFHHCTLYGFLLCFASTSVAAIYHSGFGWSAPYSYSSLPVLLGTIGGIGLLIGPAGLFIIGRRRDQALADPRQRTLDTSFITLLVSVSLTGLWLLALREHAAMGVLLIVHLALVLALFLALPYGKFVHGLYRTAALIKYALESPPGPSRRNK